MTSNKTLIALGIVAFAGMAMLTSCVKDNPDSPGFEYFPDMYRSNSPETNVAYESSYARDSMSNMLPAEGSIPRGFVAFPYANTLQGDSLAARFWTYSNFGIKQSDENEERAKVYTKCTVHIAMVTKVMVTASWLNQANTLLFRLVTSRVTKKII